MKQFLKLALLSIVLTFVACTSDDGSNLPPAEPFVGDVILETQAEVDAFTANNFFGITGNLRISAPNVNGPSDITNLSGFSTLEFVNGDVEIFSNSISTLDGFQSLEGIGGSLFISFNDDLTNINALSSLTTIGGDVSISSSENLTSIQGLSSLTEIPGNLSIGVDIGPGALDIPNLQDLSGLNNIASVGGNLSVSGTNVTTLSGLEKLTSIQGNTTISFNESLTNLTGMESITAIGISLVISNNPSLLQIDALSGIQSVGEDLEISVNNELESINGLSSIENVIGIVNVFGNVALPSIDNAFQNLTSAGSIIFSENGMETLAGFGSLVSCNTIVLGGDDTLVSISGFNALENIQSIAIENAVALQNIDGFSNINTIGEITIKQPITVADGAISISAFTNITSILTRINVIGLANEDINFLSSLETVGNSVNVVDNENLRNLCGLNALVFNGGPAVAFNVFRNLYNPTQQDILNGNCSL